MSASMSMIKSYVRMVGGGRVEAEVRFDDRCKNGHNTLSITGKVFENQPGGIELLVCSGACHDDIAKAFPELRDVIKFHLVSTDGPMHYPGNALYHAGNRDHWGLLKGEFRQHTSRGPYQNGGVAGVPNWELRIPAWGERDVYAAEKPAPVMLEWQPSGITGEGKDRDLDAARACACWPEATDAELCLEPEELKKLLMARLPLVMQEFRRVVESQGFEYTTVPIRR